MKNEEIVKRLKEIINQQERHYAFKTHTKPLLEKLIEDIEDD